MNEEIIFDEQMDELNTFYGTINSIGNKGGSLNDITSSYPYESYFAGVSANIKEVIKMLNVLDKIRDGDQYIIRPEVQTFLQKNNLQDAYPLRYKTLVRYLLTETDLDPVRFRRSLHRLEANGWSLESAGESSLWSEADKEASDKITDSFYNVLKNEPDFADRDLIAQFFTKKEGDTGDTEFIQDWIVLALTYGYSIDDTNFVINIQIGGILVDESVLFMPKDERPDRVNRIKEEYNRILDQIKLKNIDPKKIDID